MKKPMPEDQIWRYFIQIAKAIQALHQMKILHRDIKPGNIMVTNHDVIKLGDLGIAKLLKHTMAKTQIGARARPAGVVVFWGGCSGGFGVGRNFGGRGGLVGCWDAGRARGCVVEEALARSRRTPD